MTRLLYVTNRIKCSNCFNVYDFSHVEENLPKIHLFGVFEIAQLELYDQAIQFIALSLIERLGSQWQVSWKFSAHFEGGFIFQ